ncbi:MAG: AAA-like domain-containing protein, partial [Tannerella sp.]|nr:AAA-like domain-containing protein [Tannerella sp.]
PAIVRIIKNTLEFTNIPHRPDFAKDADYEDFTSVLETSLTRFCMLLDKPLVILFDEADCLSEGTLISFLRQLRNGYNNRSITPFVHSIALVGMRNIRDYKAKIRPDSQSLGSASPFNIITETYTLKNFTIEEITQLYSQHTGETGQIFEDDAIELVYEQTQGQPWLVNAIAREVIVKILQSDYTKPVTAELVSEAIQTIILRRDTHIDSLLERLKEERVRKVIEPVITGDTVIGRLSDDFLYVRDLGLISEAKGRLGPANPIYGEVIARTLSYDTQKDLLDNYDSYQVPRYLTKDGRMDMDFLMRDFQQFWRENSGIWVERYEYKEAAPHLIMMAFLQRVVNGGGQIFREMAAGTGRLDLCLVYEDQKYPIELKLRYGEKYLEKGLEQTARYMDTYGCSEGWLAIFDRRTTVKWEDKLYFRKETVDGKTVTVVGL